MRAAIFVLMGLRYSAEVTQRLFAGVTAMEESVTYQAIVSKGQLREAKKILMLQGNDRFGAPDAATTAAIESLADLEKLEALSRRLLHVQSWQELLSGA
jgi:hypothetical protein